MYIMIQLTNISMDLIDDMMQEYLRTGKLDTSVLDSEAQKIEAQRMMLPVSSISVSCRPWAISRTACLSSATRWAGTGAGLVVGQWAESWRMGCTKPTVSRKSESSSSSILLISDIYLTKPQSITEQRLIITIYCSRGMVWLIYEPLHIISAWRYKFLLWPTSPTLMFWHLKPSSLGV